MAITKSGISPQYSTSTGSSEATATANAISEPGSTRQDRIADQAEVAASRTTGSGANAGVSAAFIDGGSIKGATKL